jgi:AcrR family transcriptional regulator
VSQVEPSEPGGLRERKKRDKLRRIREAAFVLFSQKGFDDTTVREIADAAGVGLGTLFDYARDKRDVLFLLFAEKMSAANDRLLGDIDYSRPLLDQLVMVFEPYYALLAETPTLSRDFLREATFDRIDGSLYHTGAVPDRLRFMNRIADVVRRAQRRGEISKAADPELVAATVYATYAGAVREWLRGSQPASAEGVATLRKMVSIVVTGIVPARRLQR